MMTDHVDRQLRKPFEQHRLVTGAHGFLDFGKDQDVRHGAFYMGTEGIAREPEKLEPRFSNEIRRSNVCAGVTRIAGLR
jgi:hypothetical protein